MVTGPDHVTLGTDRIHCGLESPGKVDGGELSFTQQKTMLTQAIAIGVAADDIALRADPKRRGARSAGEIDGCKRSLAQPKAVNPSFVVSIRAHNITAEINTPRLRGGSFRKIDSGDLSVAQQKAMLAGGVGIEPCDTAVKADRRS